MLGLPGRPVFLQPQQVVELLLQGYVQFVGVDEILLGLLEPPHQLLPAAVICLPPLPLLPLSFILPQLSITLDLTQLIHQFFPLFFQFNHSLFQSGGSCVLLLIGLRCVQCYVLVPTLLYHVVACLHIT